MKKSIVILLMLIVAQASPYFAQKPGVVVSTKEGWHKIGEVTASFTMEKESIVVLGADKFKSIKLRVTDAQLELQSLMVYYESDEMEEISLKSNLKAGEETRVIDLKNNNKMLKKVVFTYKTVPNTLEEKARVELYGLK
jgi:hypothetical protein